MSHPLPHRGVPLDNAICLGGPCHGKVVRIEQDIGLVDVPLPPPDSGTTDYRITAESIHHPSSRIPLTVLHWNHTIPPCGHLIARELVTRLPRV
jgi:hypothetical protein